MWPFTKKKKVEEPSPAEVILEVQDAPVSDPHEDLKQVFVEAAKQAAAERAKLEAELLSSGKLQKYLKSTMKYMANEVHKKDSYDFFLMGHHNLDIPAPVFGEFANLFLKIAKEFKIQASLTGEYIRIDKAPLLKVIKELMPESPPVDMTALRDSMRQGPYR